MDGRQSDAGQSNGTQFRKEEIKPSLFTGGTTIYTENAKKENSDKRVYLRTIEPNTDLERPQKRPKYKNCSSTGEQQLAKETLKICNLQYH